MKTFVLGFVVAVVAVAGLILWIAYSGNYNVAATEEHSRLERWLLTTTMYNSVKAHAPSATATPSPMPAPEAGLPAYREMCVHCHGAPGVEAAEWAQVMRPAPPDLSEAARGWDTRELHWILQHGIKMSGMPAFGPTHSDDELWELAAFVASLPETTPREYERMTARVEPGAPVE